MKELTPEQRSQICKYILGPVWEKIYDEIITDEQKSPTNMKSIAFQMEEIFKSVAATFGMSGMS